MCTGNDLLRTLGLDAVRKIVGGCPASFLQNAMLIPALNWPALFMATRPTFSLNDAWKPEALCRKLTVSEMLHMTLTSALIVQINFPIALSDDVSPCSESGPPVLRSQR